MKAIQKWRKHSYNRELLARTRRHSVRFDGRIRRRRRRWFGVLVTLLAALLTAIYVVHNISDGQWSISKLLRRDLSQETTPEQADTSPAAAAYRTVASEIPDISPDSIQDVQQSNLDPSWASVRIATPGNDNWIYNIFLQRGDDNLWKAQKSIRTDEPEHPENARVILDGVPKDLVESIYPEKLTSDTSGLLAEPVDLGSLPTVKKAQVPPPDPVTDNVPDSERERVDKGLQKVQQLIKNYDGVAGVYVQDLNGGWGYGVRPDEVFFSASIIKVPVMVAVFRKIDQGEFSLHDNFETAPEDWAAGAGQLQWDPAGRSHAIEDYLRLMMTQSDNVATNALIRLVGGPDYVNEVAHSMRATNTVLYQKVSSAQAIIPSLDNRTTPRDMVSMLQQIAAGTAASPESTQKMIDIMSQNELESWLKEGLPTDAKAVNKAGWLYEIYDDAGIVWNEDRPYVVAILSKRGPGDPQKAKPTSTGISKAVWQTQSDS